MTTGGWITMLVSVGFVTSLLGWCIYKVLATPGEAEHLHAQMNIKTPDVDE